MHPENARRRRHAPETGGRLIRSWARVYDPLAWAISFGQVDALRRKAVALARPLAGESVLDVGCGTGALAFEVKRAEAGAMVRGIDASPEMVEVARGKARRRRVAVDFEIAAVERLPFEDGTFDLVISGFMLHHLPGEVLREGMAEITRVLRPGGRFVAADFSGAGGGLLGHIAAALGHGHSGVELQSLLETIEAAGLTGARAVPTKYRSVAFIRARKNAAGEPAAGA